MITIDFSRRGLEGTLSSDSKLPSKRNLASHLGISVITVQNAHSRLIFEGYIYSIEKKGFYVTDISIESLKQPQLHEAEKTKDYSSRTQLSSTQ